MPRLVFFSDLFAGFGRASDPRLYPKPRVPTPGVLFPAPQQET